jgi:hypothetical protein
MTDDYLACFEAYFQVIDELHHAHCGMQHAKSSESVGPGEIYLCSSVAKPPSEGGGGGRERERERES